jgi:hypothetical protein
MEACSPRLIAIPVHFFSNIGVKQISFVFGYTSNESVPIWLWTAVCVIKSIHQTPCRCHCWSRMASGGGSVGAGRGTHNTRRWPRHPCLRSYWCKTGSWWWCDHGSTRGKRRTSCPWQLRGELSGGGGGGRRGGGGSKNKVSRSAF